MTNLQKDKLSKLSQISPPALIWRPATTDTVETEDNKRQADPFSNFYMDSRPERRGIGGRQTDNVKPLAEKWYRNLMKGR